MTSLGWEQPSAALEQLQLLLWPLSWPLPALTAALQGCSFLYSAGERPVHCLSLLPGLASLRAVIGCSLSPHPACGSLEAFYYSDPKCVEWELPPCTDVPFGEGAVRNQQSMR